MYTHFGEERLVERVQLRVGNRIRCRCEIESVGQLDAIVIQGGDIAVQRLLLVLGGSSQEKKKYKPIILVQPR